MAMPSDPAHTYGSTCRLAPLPQARHDSDPLLENIPPFAAQFFYYSPIPIDDPLSAATIGGSSSDGRSAKYPVRPFAQGDNHALEKAWLEFASGDARESHAHARTRRSPTPALADKDAVRLAALVERLALQHRDLHAQGYHESAVVDSVDVSPGVGLAPCCTALVVDVRRELEKSFCLLSTRHWSHLRAANVAQQVMMRMKSPAFPVQDPSDAQHEECSRPRTSSDDADLPNRPASRVETGPTSQEPFNSEPVASAMRMPSSVRPPTLDDGISGQPFVRVGGPSPTQSPTVGSLTNHQAPVATSKASASMSGAHMNTVKPHNAEETESNSRVDLGTRPADADPIAVEIPVGISRLHMVSLPCLQMKPIYWSPVNDVAVVVRATWFYRDTMVPVEPAVANQLEAGYRELRPWTETWNDELKCAVDVGPLGEEKVSHPLWSNHGEKTTVSKHGTEPLIASEPLCAARCFRGEAAAEGAVELPTVQDRPDSKGVSPAGNLYANYHVIYQDQHAAFLLKPSLKPSAYYSRRPVAKMMKGLTVGIPVVRGFDRSAWDRIHESNGKKRGDLAEELPVALAGDGLEEGHGQMGCPGCKAEKKRAQVTDLILVVHGVGQKLAERVESFHFTHAINAFRRAVTLELSSEAVRAVLRPKQNGIMVLPVNWRHNLSFEDGGPMREEDLVSRPMDGFTLKDIEPGSIPAVRSMISDVMFDIPFYMSHHKPKMIQAMIGEANRVYRLWCKNNPSFSSQGRVHLIGHSLGSAMAIEVLSKQPTLPPSLDLDTSLVQTTRFEFDTKNLFLLGSPAGFFLLLERGRLVPRRGRQKPGADPADTVAGNVVGEAGTFGCLAVDNIYNILAKEDPIAYLLNGAVDPVYSSSLKTAYVPAATMGFFQSIGQSVRRGLLPGASAASAAAAPHTIKPPTVRLPSQLELEVHDFTREEIAERKAYLLNDNGQLDYYLRSGGGPLDVQYLNMLSAHTSYWTNQDLIRLICTEVGRKPGRANTLPGMRAAKAARRIVPVPR